MSYHVPTHHIPHRPQYLLLNGKYKNLLSLEYLVHDFYSICKTLKPRTRTIFVDMGASLAYHSSQDSPAVYINKIYRKFGIHFDHIYAYEITPTKPEDAYKKVPDELMSSFHWINVGEFTAFLWR